MGEFLGGLLVFIGEFVFEWAIVEGLPRLFKGVWWLLKNGAVLVWSGIAAIIQR